MLSGCDEIPVLSEECEMVTGRIAAKRQTAGIKFTHRPKIRFFAPQGQLVAPIQVKLGRNDGHVGLLGCAKFHLSRPRGWECGPKISKISGMLRKIHISMAVSSAS